MSDHEQYPWREALIDAALDCVIVMDEHGRIVEFNPVAERTFGYARADVIGRALADVIVPPDLREGHRIGLSRYLATKHATVLGRRVELRGMRADGTELPIELAITATPIAGNLYFTGYLRDITDRHEREAARRELEQTVLRLGNLQRLTAALATARTTQAVHEIIVQQGVAALGATVGILVRPRSDTELGVVASHGVSKSFTDTYRSYPIDSALPTAAAFRSGIAEWIEGPAAFEARYGAFAGSLETANAAVAVVPLSVAGRTIGVMAFRFSEPRTFEAADRALLESFAAVAAQSLDRALAFEQERMVRRRLEALEVLAASLAVAVSVEDVARIVVDEGVGVVEANTCTLYTISEQDGSLELLKQRGVAPGLVERLRRIAPDDSNPIFRRAVSGEALWVETEAAYAALYPSLAATPTPGDRAKAFWSIPLIVEGAAIGLLGCGFYEERRMPPAERAFVETFARHCAQALRRAQRLAREQSARKVAETARQSLATTLKSIGDGVITTDATGRITFLNPVAEQLTGWREEDARGQPIGSVFRVVSAQTYLSVEGPVERVLREGTIVGLGNHTVLIRRDGHEIPIDDSGAPIKDDGGSMVGVVLVFRNVSQKRRVEQREAFLANATALLIESLDYEKTLAGIAALAVPTLANWCSVQMAGSTSQLAVSHVDPAKVEMARALQLRYPPDPNARTGVPNVLRTGVAELYEDIPAALLEQAAVDGEHLRLLRELDLRSAMVVPLVARGVVLGAISFVRDGSAAPYTRDDLAFAEDLARRAAIAIDNARLFTAEQQARQQADVANRSKDEFLATVSHELRTPLSAILGWSQMLLTSSVAAEKHTKGLQTIERNAMAMAQLIEDLLDISRIIAGKVRLEVQPMQLEPVIDAAIEAIKLAAATKQITIHKALHETSDQVIGDPARIQQIIWNLLSNAVKFSAKGGQVDVRLRRVQACLELTVSDNGRGLDPEFLPHLFGRFRQADGSITRTHGGLGLGLAITRQLVELHGGTIDAHSEGLAKGATFVVRIPVAVDEVARVTSPGKPSDVRALTAFERPPSLAGKRILVVDDDDDGRELVKDIFEDCGCFVRTASSAAAAMTAMAAEVPDVLVSDIGMPMEDGYALIRRVRDLPAADGGGVPAVALTAFAREEDRERALNAGFMIHVAKPIQPAELVSVVAGLANS